ncbi:MAG: PAS domain S-box protein [Pyrinomonadaceae bacterium]
MNEREAGGSAAPGNDSIESQLAHSRSEVSRLALQIEQQVRVFEGIFSSISDFAYAFDRSGRFVFINKALLDLWGMTLADAVGKNFHELPYPEDLATRLQEQIEQVFTTGKQLTDETPYTNPKGVLGYYEYIFCAVHSTDGSVDLVAGSTRDITTRKKVEQQLAESEERYRTLFNSIDEGFCIVEIIYDDVGLPCDYRFIEVNRAFEKQTGLQRAVGKRIKELAPNYEKFWYETYGEIALTGKPKRFERRAESLDRWYDVYAFRIGDPSEKRVAVLFNDIGARKEAEEKIRALGKRNLEILESIGDSVVAVDRNWRFTYVNPQADELLGRRSGELLGTDLWEQYPGLSGNTFEEVFRRVADGGVAEQFTAYYPDHNRWYEVSCYHAPSGITIYFRNVSERIRAEEALREADQRKDEFLATLAHELRNPLAPIRSGLEVLRHAGDDRETADKTLDMIERQTNQVVRLVDDLLDVSRITQGKIKLRKEKFPLKQAIEMAVETSQREIDSSGNELVITLPSKPLYLEADLTRVAQIFLNILNNAAKFSPPGGTITIIAHSSGGEAIVSIADEGRGISEESLPRIFDIFGQVDAPGRRDRGGLGIGLSVVKQLAEMHGGSVEARSGGLGKGTELIVRLPVVVADEPAVRKEHPPELAEPTKKPRRVLIVDDNEDAARMLEMLLKLQGHEVQVAYDGLAALELARDFKPEVCLLDIGLPGMNGLELAREIRKFLPDALLISVSGWGQDEDRKRSREHGIDHHLVKPVEFTALMSAIGSLEKGA